MSRVCRDNAVEIQPNCVIQCKHEIIEFCQMAKKFMVTDSIAIDHRTDSHVHLNGRAQCLLTGIKLGLRKAAPLYDGLSIRCRSIIVLCARRLFTPLIKMRYADCMRYPRSICAVHIALRRIVSHDRIDQSHMRYTLNCRSKTLHFLLDPFDSFVTIISDCC